MVEYITSKIKKGSTITNVHENSSMEAPTSNMLLSSSST
jgi:hypothetical protein